MKYPETMLARCFSSDLAKPNEKGEYFFDRNATAFEAILDIYRLGQAICPPSVDPTVFNEELKFWGFDELPVPPRTASEVCRLDKLIAICIRDLKAEPQPDLGYLHHVYELIIKALDTGKNQIVVINRPGHYFDFGEQLKSGVFTFTQIKKVSFTIEELYDSRLSWGTTYFARINNDVYYLSPDRGEIPTVLAQINADGSYIKPQRQSSAYICTL